MLESFSLLSVGLIIGSYLLGCVNAAYIFSKKIKDEDIRQKGSGNAGTTNIVRNYGMISALPVFAVDVIKGCLPILLCYYFEQSTLIILLCGISVVAGHNWPIFLGFKGGKGVATTIGVLLTLNFYLALICLIVWVAMTFLTKMVSVGSITGMCMAPVLFFATNQDIYMSVLTLVLAVLTVYQHRENIKRIIAGNENKISLFDKLKKK